MLITFASTLDCVVILLEENWCWSCLGLDITCTSSLFTITSLKIASSFSFNFHISSFNKCNFKPALSKSNINLMIFFYDQKRILSQWKLSLLNHQHFITNGSIYVYRKSPIKPSLSNKPPLFRGRKLISPPASLAPYYSLINDKLC